MFDAEFCFAGLMLTFDLVCACCQQSILGNENRLRVYRDVREILTYKHAAMLCKPTVPWKGTTLLFWEQRWTWVQIYGHNPTQPTSPTTWLKLKICTYTKVNTLLIGIVSHYCRIPPTAYNPLPPKPLPNQFNTFHTRVDSLDLASVIVWATEEKSRSDCAELAAT